MIRQDIDIDGYWKVIMVYDVELGQDNSGFTHTDFNNHGYDIKNVAQQLARLLGC
mgnify:CR=1 FL=1